MWCDGGLALCTVCGLAEGELTTECPGMKTSEDQRRRIYSVGDLDFRDGKWVDEPNPTNQSWDYARKACPHLYENQTPLPDP